MNLVELNDVDELPTWDIGLEWLRPLFNYCGEVGCIPVEANITLTGHPGVGKTRVALQLANAIAKANASEYEVQFKSYESTAQALKALTSQLEITALNDFDVDITKNPAFRKKCITVIDSVDFWASKVYGERYPTDIMAELLEATKQQHCPVIQIHHKTKSSNKLSGSANFLRTTDVVLEVIKDPKDDRQVVMRASSKNRWPGEVSEVRLVHTTKGLVPAPPTAAEAFWVAATGWFGR